MNEQYADIGNGVTLCFERLGPESGRPLLLVMGLGSQMVFWEDDFCAALVDRGFHVIRFDNRDNGRSTIFEESAPPTVRQLLLRDARGSAYPLHALADDAAALLAHLGIDRADVAGASMGGMIAQLVAIRHPERTRSLVSIMSTTGSRIHGQPKPSMYPILLRKPASGRDAVIADTVRVLQAIGSKRYPAAPEVLTDLATRAYDRGYHPAGTARQLAAISTTENRARALVRVKVPATVIHGIDDPLVRPSGGRATAAALKRASLLMLSGMAHDMPRPLWPQIIEGIAATSAAAG